MDSAEFAVSHRRAQTSPDTATDMRRHTDTCTISECLLSEMPIRFCIMRMASASAREDDEKGRGGGKNEVPRSASRGVRGPPDLGDLGGFIAGDFGSAESASKIWLVGVVPGMVGVVPSMVTELL